MAQVKLDTLTEIERREWLIYNDFVEQVNEIFDEYNLPFRVRGTMTVEECKALLEQGSVYAPPTRDKEAE